MTEYGQEILRDYINALVRAERLLSDAEHDVWMVDEVSSLYNISRHLRDGLNSVIQGMSQELYKSQKDIVEPNN